MEPLHRGIALASLAFTVIMMVAAAIGSATAGALTATPPSSTSPVSVPSATPTPTPTHRPTPRPTLLVPPPGKTTATKPKPSTSTTTVAPAGGSSWLLASGGTGVVGTGSKGLITYRVEVEKATGLSASAVADVVDSTLDGPLGWINEGWKFQRVTLPVAQVKMIVRVARPATVDAFCAKYGLNTGGVVSCRGGNYVMINLTRWNTGVSAYGDDVGGYRRLVINHEVGHRLGHGHATCPGAGQPSPVMMQVYYTGLQGCAKNVWPYAADGTKIG